MPPSPRSPLASPLRTRVSSPTSTTAALLPSLPAAATGYYLPATPPLPAHQPATARRSCTLFLSLPACAHPGTRPCAARAASPPHLTGHSSTLSCCAASVGGWARPGLCRRSVPVGFAYERA